MAAPQQGWATCSIPLVNTGKAGTAPYSDSDVYRLSATSSGKGWSAWLPDALATAKAGQRTTVQVYGKHIAGAAHLGTVRLTATSESDPTKKATATCAVAGSKSVRRHGGLRGAALRVISTAENTDVHGAGVEPAQPKRAVYSRLVSPVTRPMLG